MLNIFTSVSSELVTVAEHAREDYRSPHAHRVNIWRNPKLDRPAVSSYGC